MPLVGAETSRHVSGPVGTWRENVSYFLDHVGSDCTSPHTVVATCVQVLGDLWVFFFFAGLAVTSWMPQVQIDMKKMCAAYKYTLFTCSSHSSPYFQLSLAFVCEGVDCSFSGASLLVLSWGQALSDCYTIAKHASWSQVWNKSIISPAIRKHVSCSALWPDERPNKPWSTHSVDYESVESPDFHRWKFWTTNYFFNFKQKENVDLTCRRRLASQVIFALSLSSGKKIK